MSSATLSPAEAPPSDVMFSLASGYWVSQAEGVLMTIHFSTPQRSLITPTHMLIVFLFVVGALLLVGFYVAPRYLGATSTSTATPSEAPVSQRLEPLTQTLRSHCAVTGTWLATPIRPRSLP